MNPAASAAFDLAFVAVAVLAIVAAVLYGRITGRGFFSRIQQQLQSRGFAISHTRQRHRGPAYVELARELAASVQRFCESLPATPQACRSAPFEGR